MDPQLRDGAYILRNPHGKCIETDPRCDECVEFQRECDGIPTDVIILLYFEEGRCGRFLASDGKRSRELTHAECVRAIEDYDLLEFISAEEIMKEHRKSAAVESYYRLDHVQSMMDDDEEGEKIFHPDLNRMRN